MKEPNKQEVQEQKKTAVKTRQNKQLETTVLYKPVFALANNTK